MRFGKMIASAVALAVATTPVVASAANPAAKVSVASAQRVGAPVKGEKALGGGIIVAVLAAAAVIAGIIIVADDDDDDSDSN